MTIQRIGKLGKADPAAAALQARQVNGPSLALFFILAGAAAVAAIVMERQRLDDAAVGVTTGLIVVGLYLLVALKIANQWEKAVVLRMGKFAGLRGPGLFWIVPIVDSVSVWIDHRVNVTPFDAEKTLTQDTTQ